MVRLIEISLVLVLSGSAAVAQDDKVFKQLAPENCEALLKKLDVDFKKVESKTPGTLLYDVKRKNFNARFYLFDGKDLMLDATFPRLPLERLNAWNQKAKFSRVCLQKGSKGEFTTLESNLDLIGGVTEGAIRQFFNTFDEELRLYSRFLGESSEEDKMFTPVTGEKLESILKGLGIAYQKKIGKDDSAQLFELEFQGNKMRLVNFGGKDLMLDAHFKAISLEDANRYNLEKKFVRVVAYDNMGTRFTALESNLDCEVGTTDAILRNYLLGFQDDIKSFSKFLQGMK